MSGGVAIFVEGRNEERLLPVLLDRMGLQGFVVERIGGSASHLDRLKSRFAIRRNERRRIAVVLDADRDADATRTRLEAEICKLSLPVDAVFLVPDDRSPGSIETLLEMMAPKRHRRIHECFTRYRECLKEISPEYDLPNRKAAIYAYCEAIGNGPKERDRDFGNAGHWSLDAPALNPLKAFLRKCAGMNPIDETA